MEKNRTVGWQERNDFIVRYPLDLGIPIIQEVGRAFELFWWYLARVTAGFITESGIKCGAVLGLLPITDLDIADNISRMGRARSQNQIRKWRHKLANWGYIAWKRTPAGQQTFIIEPYYPAGECMPPPSWTNPYIAELIDKRLEHSSTGVTKVSISTATMADHSATMAVSDQRSSECVSEKQLVRQETADETFTHVFRKEPEKANSITEKESWLERWKAEGRCWHCGANNPRPAMTPGMAYCGKCDGLYPLLQPSQCSGSAESGVCAA